ncbi:MAG: hypothetical protein QXN77_09210 [Candidatus Caldarchaeum sp.]
MAEGRRGPVLVAEFNVPTPLLGVFASEKDELVGMGLISSRGRL